MASILLIEDNPGTVTPVRWPVSRPGSTGREPRRAGRGTE